MISEASNAEYMPSHSSARRLRSRALGVLNWNSYQKIFPGRLCKPRYDCSARRQQQWRWR